MSIETNKLNLWGRKHEEARRTVNLLRISYSNSAGELTNGRQGDGVLGNINSVVDEGGDNLCVKLQGK